MKNHRKQLLGPPEYRRRHGIKEWQSKLGTLCSWRESPQPDGIIHKLVGGYRGADVVIVSTDLAGQNNRLGSQGPLDEQF